MTTQYNADINQMSFYQSLQIDSHELALQETEKEKYQNIQMLDGQKLTISQKFMIQDPDYPSQTQLYLTNYRLIFARPLPKSIPYGFIQNFNRDDKCLKIKLKTGVVTQITTEYASQLQSYIKKSFMGLPFCFEISRQPEKPLVYDSGAQIERMRLDANQFTVLKNSNGNFCSTYPCFLIIPKSIHQSSLQQLRKCRNLSRIPVMSYFHDKYSVGIWRAAKLKPKLSNDVKKFDIAYRKQISEDLITYKIQENGETNDISSFQSLSSLKQNFHKFVSSYIAISKVQGNSQSSTFFKTLSKWFQQIQRLISFAYHICSKLINKNHVFLEQLHGFDRIPQIISLCQIIIDPFYRTFNGLSILIEKEWICFGHPFEIRCGFTKKQQEAAPIFMQFLECLHQLVTTHPQSFEYSSTYLARIAYQAYTTKYKNFLEKPMNQKIEQKLRNCPQCIWTELIRQKSYYNYQWNGNKNARQLWEMRRKPSVKEYRIWNQYYDMITKMEVEKKINGNQKQKFETLYSYIHNKGNKNKS